MAKGPRLILHKKITRLKLRGIAPETYRKAMPLIVLTLQRAAQRAAPKHTGKMASQIEGQVELDGLRGLVIPRGRVAHLVHNPTRGIDKVVPRKQEALKFFPRGLGHGVLRTHSRRPARAGQPFLDEALLMSEDRVNQIIEAACADAVEEAVA